MIGLVIGGIFIILGIFILCMTTFDIFRFEYALNRAHVVVKYDTLGNMLILVGLMTFSGQNIEPAKIGLIFLFIWISNPAASRMVAKAETGDNPDPGREYGMSEYEGG